MAPAKTKIIIGALALLFLCSLAWAVEINELGNVSEKDYGPEYYYAVSGTVSGQAAPGVQSIYINSKKMALDAGLNFYTNVSLAQGQKYLTITTAYRNLKFTRKYLVIRHPKIKKPFVIHVPKQEFQKIIEKKQPSRVKRRVVYRPKPKPTKPKIYRPFTNDKWLGFESVQELAPGKLFVVRNIDDKYFAAVYVRSIKTWYPLNRLTLQQFKELLEKDPPYFSGEAES